MSMWQPPQTPWEIDYNATLLYVCFNDECTYFVKGWDWMWNTYHRYVSYRHMMDPASGETNPIPVSSYESLKDGIIEEH